MGVRESLDSGKISLKKESWTGICAYIIADSEDESIAGSPHGAGCHAGVIYKTWPASWSKIYSSLVPHPSLPSNAFHEWVDFLFSAEESPYRSLFKQLKVEYDIARQYFVIHDINKGFRPAVNNFLTASRMTYESPGRIVLWYKLVKDHGFTKAEAFYTVSVFQATLYKKDLKLEHPYNSIGHQVTTHFYTDFKRIRDSDFFIPASVPKTWSRNSYIDDTRVGISNFIFYNEKVYEEGLSGSREVELSKLVNDFFLSVPNEKKSDTNKSNLRFRKSLEELRRQKQENANGGSTYVTPFLKDNSLDLFFKFITTRKQEFFSV